MATRQADPGEDIVPINDDEPTILDSRVVAAYESMIESVPEAGGGGVEGILAVIAAAKDAKDLDAPWRAEAIKGHVNSRLRVFGIRKLPSEFEGGLPWFLIIDAAVVATGESVAITCGALSVVAQLVKAHQLDQFPLDVIPRVATRPSSRGFYPVHLEIVR